VMFAQRSRDLVPAKAPIKAPRSTRGLCGARSDGARCASYMINKDIVRGFTMLQDRAGMAIEKGERVRVSTRRPIRRR